MSNVKAVESAQAAQKAAERQAEKDISDYKKAADKKVSDAVNDKNTAIRKAKEAVKQGAEEFKNEIEAVQDKPEEYKPKETDDSLYVDDEEEDPTSGGVDINYDD